MLYNKISVVEDGVVEDGVEKREVHWERGFSMFCRLRPALFLLLMLCTAIAIGLTGACTSRSQYKNQADEEVYNIIDNKWQNSFGEQANYTISDVPPAPNDIRIEEQVPRSGIVALVQAVAIATARNRDYQSQKEQLYLSALDLTLARHRFARQWFGTIDGAYNRNAADEALSSDSQAGFSQLLADGAAISTAIAIDWARFLTGDPRTSLGSVLTSSIRQPLLRGAGRKVAQENLTQSERNVLYQIRSFNRYRKTFVVSIVTDYYRVLQRSDEVVNAKNSYQRKTDLKNRQLMEYEIGRTPRFQVDQTEQSELNDRDNYIRAQQSYQQTLDQFKIRLSLPTSAEIELDPNELKALSQIGVQQPDYTLHDAVETALLNRLDLATSSDRIDDSFRKVTVAIDGLEADLDFVASLNVSSTAPTQVDRLQFHEGNYGLGLEADLPFDRKSERNAYRQTLITLQQRQRDYDEQKAQVELDIRGAYRRLRQEADSYSTQKISLELAQQRVDMSAILWETGRANARDVLEAQDALLSAQNRLTSALIAHTVAKLNFFRDLDVLQVKPDGMWEQVQ